MANKEPKPKSFAKRVATGVLKTALGAGALVGPTGCAYTALDGKGENITWRESDAALKSLADMNNKGGLDKVAEDMISWIAAQSFCDEIDPNYWEYEMQSSSSLIQDDMDYMHNVIAQRTANDVLLFNVDAVIKQKEDLIKRIGEMKEEYAKDPKKLEEVVKAYAQYPERRNFVASPWFNTCDVFDTEKPEHAEWTNKTIDKYTAQVVQNMGDPKVAAKALKRIQKACDSAIELVETSIDQDRNNRRNIQTIFGSPGQTR